MAGEKKKIRNGPGRLRRAVDAAPEEPASDANRGDKFIPEFLENCDGFLTPDGRFVAIQDADTMFSVITRGTEDIKEVVETLRSFAQECFRKGYLEAACAYMEKALPLLEDPRAKAACLLSLGRTHEQTSNYGAAREAYSRAFELPQERNETWYFLNNNLAYCLNLERRHEEAEKHCRAAIKIDHRRHNAHKNLGIALQGRERYATAARSFLRATRLCPDDTRALGLLEELLAAHGEVLEQNPDLKAQLHDCHETAQAAKGRIRVQ